MFFSSAASAAGLGKLTVLSALGQPLRAEIELTAVSAEEANGLVAKLAPADAFRAANIEFNPALMSLRFAVEQRNGRQFIRISSSQPVNEPFVDMLLELSWNSGRLVREYTFLLDPAELRATQPAQVAAAPVAVPQSTRAAAPARQPVQESAPSPQPSQPAPQAAQPVRPKVERAESPRAANVDTTEYRVRSGDTLGRIAGRLKPADISLDMMLVALYRANPDAFIGNNMNRLKSGQILTVPDSDAIRGASEGEARGVVVAHAADFNAYRNKLAGQVASAAPSRTPEATQSAAGKITAKVEERPTAANESKDQLKLSKAGAGGGASGKSAALEAEDKIAKERALADATARVKELEKNVNDLEKLMVVKSKSGTEASKTAMAETAPAATAPAPAAQAPAPAVSAPVKPKRVLTTPPPAPEPTLADTLMDNITYIGAGLAVLLLAAFGLSRRKKKDEVLPAEPSILGVPTDHAQSMFAETGGQSVDTSNSVFNSSFAPSASQLDTNEVDPVAEADVYIAYGRDAQAEEILKEALRTHPERMPVRLKLLEIYAARKDQRSFETQAGEMYGLTKGQGEDWAQAAALGMTIDPANPLYASAAGAAAAAPATPEAIAEQAILNQMHEEGVSAEPDLMDLTFADSEPTALPEPEQVQAAAAPADDNTLDFDLGGLSFEPVTNTEPAPSAAAAQANPHEMEFTAEPIVAPAPPAEPEQSFDMAFDMDFDAPPAAATQAVEEKALDDIRLDFSSHAELPADIHMADPVHSFDLPTLPEEAPAAAAHPLADLDAMNFDLPATPAAAPAPAEDPFALPELPELPQAAPSFAASPTFTAAPQFDMSGIDLDLPTDSLPVLAAEEVAPVGQADLSASHMEMETKLDLAIAYQEIGDKEGARELLDEVIKGGSADQVSKANDMRAKLA
ncbi:FimV/HubP family polar landmark protein [Massilia sp. R2A-15]|uniref:FimV/HubP family polar landmark protein n=1 Tax=Massilia sp. R2A-15 TaxID=3064278 RepID=UPI00273662C0|nr:FimV/HubP family polar landmark protein [Massilia sp. R2A-15]WLI87764.1 FimV/HubP family polar landmark protein [Massilia sp. R2A-15]